jgi:hypothetical protein
MQPRFEPAAMTVTTASTLQSTAKRFLAEVDEGIEMQEAAGETDQKLDFCELDLQEWPVAPAPLIVATDSEDDDVSQQGRPQTRSVVAPVLND